MQKFNQINLTKFVMVIAVLSIASIAAMGQEVRYNFMPGANFASYHTYRWVTTRGRSQPNQIVDAEIKQSVDSQLAAKGLTKTDSDKADLEISYQVGIDHERQWNGSGSGAGPFWGAGIGMGSATSSAVANGNLVLDMYDPVTKQLMWTGTATKTLDPSSNEEKNLKSLNKAMRKLLKNYPPK
ncbi:DUF4136 domain-containing protein [Edaphobacter sp. HDX4]|uniref:DUF4136 domain-containing protein n=1 Tax=Edaphobacter sp. HDX4 TaxID=2794064 RepID=UPI002FE56A0F